MELVLFPGMIFLKDISDQQLENTLGQIWVEIRKLIDEDLLESVYINESNPTDKQLEDLYNSMLKTGGFEKELSEYDDFVNGIKSQN